MALRVWKWGPCEVFCFVFILCCFASFLVRIWARWGWHTLLILALSSSIWKTSTSLHGDVCYLWDFRRSRVGSWSYFAVLGFWLLAQNTGRPQVEEEVVSPAQRPGVFLPSVVGWLPAEPRRARPARPALGPRSGKPLGRLVSRRREAGPGA